MFHFGFDWIANANGDMAFYVLAATHLMGHGLRSPVNLAALADNHGFASSAQALDSLGIRPGVQITLGALSAVTRRPPVTLYMPMALSMTMAGICATGALAMQASRRWWAATVAAALLVVSPLAGYGVLQQLIPQNWGLGLAAGLFAWLMRPEMYQGRRPPLSDLFVVSSLGVGAFVVASEVAAALMPGYVLYFALLLARRAGVAAGRGVSLGCADRRARAREQHVPAPDYLVPRGHLQPGRKSEELPPGDTVRVRDRSYGNTRCSGDQVAVHAADTARHSSLPPPSGRACRRDCRRVSRYHVERGRGRCDSGGESCAGSVSIQRWKRLRAIQAVHVLAAISSGDTCGLLVGIDQSASFRVRFGGRRNRGRRSSSGFESLRGQQPQPNRPSERLRG